MKTKKSWWFRAYKTVLKLFYKKPQFIYLGEKPTQSSIILSNHEATQGPLSLEIYAEFPFRMWGTHLVNSGFINLYKYLSKTYYHQKKNWNLFLARIFCLIATPLTFLFYKGLKIISTYEDVRFKSTLTESIETLDTGNNIVIFPENSSDGYHKELTNFYTGFLMLAKQAYRKGTDVPIYVAYLKQKESQFVFDKPILYSELLKQFKTSNDMAAYLLERCNTLGKNSYPKQ